MSSESKSCDLKVKQRPTQRGLRKCADCGAINGNRALLCRNTDCPRNKNALDGVQLMCQRAGRTVYSLRTKERDREVHPRNFVFIEDVTLSLQPNAAVVASKAICHVDSCKKASDCQHIKACREASDQMPKAQVFNVSREVLWNLNISQEQKLQLWQLYKQNEEQEQLPSVQRLNATTFAVKCERSDTFPAGRLHVTAVANGLSTKKRPFACACRKLKIILEPDNSLVMQDEICDHLLLVLAGLLSSPQGKTVYGNFTKSLQSFWMPDKLETPLCEVAHDDLCLSLNINIGGDVDQNEDIFIFDNEHCDDLLSMPDALSDVIYNVEPAPVQANGTSGNAVVHYANDAQLLSNYDIYGEQQDQHLELTDCNIELMDQCQLTNQIDLSSDDLELPLVSEPYNILAPPAIFAKTTATTASNQLPPIELPTIAVVKKPAIKASEIVDEVKARKQPPLPAKRALIVNDPIVAANAIETVDEAVQPALAYSCWLDHVIELLNESIVPLLAQALSTHLVQQSFYVHKETFSHFCKSFSAGIKRRPLHQLVQIESGKYKGLTKYVWHFSASHTVKRIFSTNNISLQLERAFEQQTEGQFTPYVRQYVPSKPTQPKQRIVHTKLELYMVKMLFDINQQLSAQNVTSTKPGLLLSWTPDVLKRSNFGLMMIEFTLQTCAPP